MMDMGGQIEDEAAAGLLSVDNAGLLGIIKDEESCQDSDFSEDEKDLAAGKTAPGDDDLPPGVHGTIKKGQLNDKVDKQAASGATAKGDAQKNVASSGQNNQTEKSSA